MHDCRKIEAGLVELVFGGLGEGERRRLMSEVETCAACSDEYNSMTEALSLFDGAAQASAPAEGFWAEHHYAIQRRINETAAVTTAKVPTPFWKRLFTLRLPVPLPAAASNVPASNPPPPSGSNSASRSPASSNSSSAAVPCPAITSG